MPLDLFDVLQSGLYLAVFSGVYGLLVGVLWSPFLLAARFRRLFASLSDYPTWANYLIAIPVPAVLWGFLFGCGLSLSGDLLDPGPAAPAYAAGVDGVVFATVLAVPLWPVLLLRVLPVRGVPWTDGDLDTGTVLLTVAGTLWYHGFLVLAGYGLAVLAGFGQVMSHSA